MAIQRASAREPVNRRLQDRTTGEQDVVRREAPHKVRDLRCVGIAAVQMRVACADLVYDLRIHLRKGTGVGTRDAPVERYQQRIEQPCERQIDHVPRATRPTQARKRAKAAGRGPGDIDDGESLSTEREADGQKVCFRQTARCDDDETQVLHAPSGRATTWPRRRVRRCASFPRPSRSSCENVANQRNKRTCSIARLARVSGSARRIPVAGPARRAPCRAGRARRSHHRPACARAHDRRARARVACDCRCGGR